MDEISEMPLEQQAMLLRIIQEKCYYKLGADNLTYVDVRIIAATNVNLQKKIEEKKFRKDLYYRLNIVPLKVPPLTDRGDDILLLSEAFINQELKDYRSNLKLILSSDVISKFKSYHWPGNVRELENVIKYAVMHSRNDNSNTIDTSHLPPNLFGDKPKKLITSNIKGKNSCSSGPIGDFLLDVYNKTNDNFIKKFNENNFKYLITKYTYPGEPKWKELWEKYISERDNVIKDLQNSKLDNNFYNQIININKQNIKWIYDCAKNNFEIRGIRATKIKMSMVLGIKIFNINFMMPKQSEE